MKSFIIAYQKYMFYHINIYNRLLHIIILLEIPYSFKLLKEKKYFQSFNNFLFRT